MISHKHHADLVGSRHRRCHREKKPGIDTAVGRLRIHAQEVHEAILRQGRPFPYQVLGGGIGQSEAFGKRVADQGFAGSGKIAMGKVLAY